MNKKSVENVYQPPSQRDQNVYVPPSQRTNVDRTNDVDDAKAYFPPNRRQQGGGGDRWNRDDSWGRSAMTDNDNNREQAEWRSHPIGGGSRMNRNMSNDWDRRDRRGDGSGFNRGPNRGNR